MAENIFNSIEFNHELFEKLRRSKHETLNVDKYKWFELSYNEFRNSPLNNKKDLIHLIAFAYSWMPTMAQFKSTLPENLDELINKINSFNGINSSTEFVSRETEVKEVLLLLIPIVNNSIVGTSKVLHFVNPRLFSIFDSRVLKGLNNVLAQGGAKKIPEYIISDKIKAIPLYVEYTKLMLRWLENIGYIEPNITLRDIEVLLYLSDTVKALF
ncbi:hypothetical protein PQ469_19340 [Mucilaginibacter sp. KACC 22773]|uniref:hypothetical protein n=1 Tax=Mucilaginibacter sp. KACC 22773 TaxID=3025671 RepID=UPI002366C6A5|nr:hypothetical protein [Mucilaginibacter sp. KACC 22773]WDF76048.1 hypothetical protein PQ469_19340 [Mucilaginibacter sp. KACC 22773]